MDWFLYDNDLRQERVFEKSKRGEAKDPCKNGVGNPYKGCAYIKRGKHFFSLLM